MRRTGPSAATVTLVRERDGQACVLCGTTNNLTTHHRRARGMGGSRWPGINLPTNLLTLCGSGTTGCHGFVESYRNTARTQGYLVSQHADPAELPVFTHHGWVLLDNEGESYPMELQETNA